MLHTQQRIAHSTGQESDQSRVKSVSSAGFTIAVNLPPVNLLLQRLDFEWRTHLYLRVVFTRVQCDFRRWCLLSYDTPVPAI